MGTMELVSEAYGLLEGFKGGRYLHGMGVLGRAGEVVARHGRRVALVRSGFAGIAEPLAELRESFQRSGLEVVVEIPGARPNAPREDLFRITEALREVDFDVLVSFGGGSVIDCAKAAEVLRALGGTIEDYFGVGMVSNKLQQNALKPHVAIQTAASSAAHLTKYSNITDVGKGQKKLIVDEAIVPTQAIFDYEVTASAPFALTSDGALDGMAHILEVFYGAGGGAHYDLLERLTIGVHLVLEYLPRLREDPGDRRSREALGLATDLGGYAIMLGGTNGAHLTSFSLVDILSHGRACALMQPYWTVFFAPAIPAQIAHLRKILAEHGLASREPSVLGSDEGGTPVAEGLMAFQRSIGFPTTLGEVEGFGPEHIERALEAAKNPQLRMKLENMPVPLTAEIVDDCMRPVLEAAATGRLEGIRTL